MDPYGAKQGEKEYKVTKSHCDMDISQCHQIRHPGDRLHLLCVPAGATHEIAYVPHLLLAVAEADTVASSQAIGGR